MSLRRPRRRPPYLEWDPHARAEHLAGAEDTDLAQLLALHNAGRARQGLEPRTLEEFREHVMRAADRSS